MTRISVALVMVFGCGGVTQDPDAAAIDAASVDTADTTDAPQTIDAPTDATAARCNPTAAFGQPVAVAGVNTSSNDTTPFLTPDELTIYFSSNRPGGVGGNDIYTATRSSPTGAFGTPALVNGVNLADNESRPVLNASGLTLYAEVRRGAGTPYHIERATRQNTSASFGAFSAVAAVNSTSNDVAPTILPDESAMYIVSGRGGNADIWRASGSGGTWLTPVLATGTNLSSTDGEDYPAVAPDDLTIFFASGRPGGVGSTDIWVATRSSVAQGFLQPVNLTAVNSAGGDWPGWVSPDGCVLYFMRENGAAGQDIFVAQRGM